jgi:hypothetical protein
MPLGGNNDWIDFHQLPVDDDDQRSSYLEDAVAARCFLIEGMQEG